MDTEKEIRARSHKSDSFTTDCKVIIVLLITFIHIVVNHYIGIIVVTNLQTLISFFKKILKVHKKRREERKRWIERERVREIERHR